MFAKTAVIVWDGDDDNDVDQFPLYVVCTKYDPDPWSAFAV